MKHLWLLLALAGCGSLVRREPHPLATLPLVAVAAPALPDLHAGAAVLHLWLPGCADCKQEIPALVAGRQAVPELTWLAPAIARDGALTLRTAREWGLDWPLAVSNGNVLAAIGVSAVPSTLFIRDGEIVAVVEGPIDEATLIREAKALVGG